jgi:hypothetical protein
VFITAGSSNSWLRASGWIRVWGNICTSPESFAFCIPLHVACFVFFG